MLSAGPGDPAPGATRRRRTAGRPRHQVAGQPPRPIGRARWPIPTGWSRSGRRSAPMKPGAAIGIIPDGKGGTWLHHRSEPPIIHFDASRQVASQTFGDKMFVQAHGFCRTATATSGQATAARSPTTPRTAGRGFQMFKFSPEGKLLLTLGKAGVSQAGNDTFIGPTACAIAPNGDIVIADGHWPRPTTAQQDGDRIVRYTKDGKFVASYGKLGTGPGEFMGPHALAFDSQGRLLRRRPLEQPHSDLRPGHEVRRRVAALRPTERRGDPQGRHARRRRLRIEPRDRRPAAGARRRRQRPAQSVLATRHPDRQREGRLAALLHSRDRPRRAWPPTSWATSSVGSRAGATPARRAAVCRSS